MVASSAIFQNLTILCQIVYTNWGMKIIRQMQYLKLKYWSQRDTWFEFTLLENCDYKYNKNEYIRQEFVSSIFM